jgi:hypothetical protein
MSPLTIGRFSRRQFIGTGTKVAAGAAIANRLLRGDQLHAAAPDDPLPIPTGSPALGGGFHVYGPTPDGSFDPIDAEPCPIGNVNAVVGLAYVDGRVTRTDTTTGDVAELPFIASDMRFVQGVYRGVDGKARQGTFGFI